MPAALNVVLVLLSLNLNPWSGNHEKNDIYHILFHFKGVMVSYMHK